MRAYRSLAVVAAFLMVTACGAPEQATVETSPVPETAADWILTNGQILTVDADFNIVEAIAVSGDRILAVGSTEEIMAHAGPGTEVTDLDGQTVVPGLVDNHMHFVRATKDWYRHVRWDGIQSRAQALAMVAERAAILPDGEWAIVFGGWHFSQFADNSEEFTRAELDAVSPDVPIYLQQNYRRGFANSAALAVAGITAETVYEGGGRLVRDADGTPTGEFVGAPAMTFITQHMPSTSPRLQ